MGWSGRNTVGLLDVFIQCFLLHYTGKGHATRGNRCTLVGEITISGDN